MTKYYKVIFVYPDGHIEEIDDQFNNGKDALNYGNNLFVQVKNTEDVFQRGDSSDDAFGFKGKIEPYFMIVETNGKKHRLVFDSRSR